MSEVAQLIESYYGNDYASAYAPYFNNIAQGKNVNCPFHDDKVASMSIDYKTGLFFCHPCGEKGNFIQFYMRTYSLPYIEACKRICDELRLDFPEAKKPEIVKTYDYLDLRGNLICQTVKFEPKDFRQRQLLPDGSWQWNLKGVKPILYNLSQVVNSDQIIICEGEKDVDTLAYFQIVGTTNPMGAGKWKNEFNNFLENKDVVLCADNDKPGKEHMLKVGKSLEGIARSISWLDFPDKFATVKKFDLTDFCNSFGNRSKGGQALKDLIRSARKFEPQKIIIPKPDTDLSNKVKNWIKAAPGEFTARDIDYDLLFQTDQEREERTQILEKFVDEKILSREGTRRGIYRPYQADLEKMDFQESNDDFLPLWLPFGLHDMVGILPGNIVLIPGSPNAGKTAMILNIIKENQDMFNVHYFNSEMGGGELKNRLSKFEDIDINHWGFNAYHRDENFADVVFKGQINLNIIDFLEVHDNFYLVGEKIKQIHSALDGSVAIIALQRNTGSEFGLGGQRSMEKARLVLNVSPGEAKITKAKNFVDPNINPNGQKIKFKLVNGCKFIQDGEWYKEEV